MAEAVSTQPHIFAPPARAPSPGTVAFHEAVGACDASSLEFLRELSHLRQDAVGVRSGLCLFGAAASRLSRIAEDPRLKRRRLCQRRQPAMRERGLSTVGWQPVTPFW